MNGRRITLAAVLALMAMMLFVPVSEADAYSNGDLNFTVVDEQSIDINAMTSSVMEVDVFNNGTSSYDIQIGVSSGYSGLYIRDSVQNVNIAPGSHKTVAFTMYSAKYVEAGSYPCTVTVKQYTPGNTELPNLVFDVNVGVHSIYGSEDEFNHILGTFANPLPAPLNSPAVTTIISFIMWLVIAYFASIAVTALLGKVIIRTKDKTGEELDNYMNLKRMWKFIFAIIMMYGITQCLNIFGANESLVGTVTDITSILFTLCSAMIVWTLFRTFVVEMGIKKMDQDYSLTPLILMVGKIVIFFGTALTTLAVFGINLISIITAMGLVTTGVSLGAKNVIGQFISGLIILIERPFVIGDKIKVAGDNEVLIVKNIGFMTTTFKKWTNEEIYVIPNSVLMDSPLINITRDNVNYKVYDYYTIDHDADVNRAREILLQCAYEHPGVVTEGAFGKPDVKFYAVDLTQVTLRLSFTVSNHESYGTYAGEIRKRVFDMFNEENISIPYIQVTANMFRPKIVETGAPDPDGM